MYCPSAAFAQVPQSIWYGEETIKVWVDALQTLSQTTMLRFLITLAPHLQKLDIRRPDDDYTVDPDRYLIYRTSTPSIWELSENVQCGMLQSLRHLTIHSIAITSVLHQVLHSKVIRLPALKTLKLYSELDLDYLVPDDVSLGRQLIEGEKLDIENLIIHGWMSLYTVHELVRACKAIMSVKLVYKAFKDLDNPPACTSDIWQIMGMVKIL